MKNILAVIAMLAAVGCGGGDAPDDNHGYGWHFDTQSAAGIKIRYAGAKLDALLFLEPQAIAEYFDRHFGSVVECTGIAATPPAYVIYVPYGSIGENIGGRYMGGPPLILIVHSAAFRHETVHYLLQQSTGDGDGQHTSPFFQTCA